MLKYERIKLKEEATTSHQPNLNDLGWVTHSFFPTSFEVVMCESGFLTHFFNFIQSN